MTSWTEMSAMQFDQALAPTSKAREVVRTAGETLFPDLLPEPKRKQARPAPEPMPGEVPLFDLDPS